jgi:hypothetical protein
MSERSWARIKIGGNLPRSKLEEFWDLLANEDFDGEIDPPQNELKLLTVLWLMDGHILPLEKDEATGGQFLELEEWLQGNGLSFNRYSAGSAGSWDPERVMWRPGGMHSFMTDDDGEIVIYQDTLMTRMNTFRAIFDALPPKADADRLRQLFEQLFRGVEQLTSLAVPPLPPLVIVG